MDLKGKSGIYVIRNIVNDKVYIGKAKDLSSRKSSHFSQLNSGKHSNKKLQSEYNLYGKNIFAFEVLEITDDLKNRESYYVNKFNSIENGYNIDDIDKPKCKPIIQSLINDDYIMEFPSISEASRQTGINKCMISFICNGKYESIRGYKFKFAN